MKPDKKQFEKWATDRGHDIKQDAECSGEYFSYATHSAWLAYQAGVERGIIPKGWKLVPIEPTDAMYRTGLKHIKGKGTAWSVTDLYKAMISAAS